MKDKEIIAKEAFLVMARQNNLNPVEVVPGIKLTIQMVCDEASFLQLASTKATEIFYFYKYPEDHEVLITGDTFVYANRKLQELINYLEISEAFQWTIDEEIYDDLIDDEEMREPYALTDIEETIKKEVMDYNGQVDKTELSIPRQFMAFYIDSGCLIGVNKIIEAPAWPDAEDKLYAILSSHKELIEQKIEVVETNKNAIKEKLKEYLKNDTSFRLSTNKSLRTEYAESLWKNKAFRWIREGFNTQRDYPTADYFNFIERVYNEIKYFRTSTTHVPKG